MGRYLIGLGSSHPAGFEYIQRACLLLDMSFFMQVKSVSALYPSPAMGGQTQFNFVNAAVAITTLLPADGLWFFLRSVEQKLGRVRLGKNGPRTIDLDVLWCVDGNISTPYLKLPHPALFERPFALNPATEAAQLAKWPYLQ
jgi:2-amino-4-hydroxy-6-hydroxymethyldihydropteridine diphosphokinase